MLLYALQATRPWGAALAQALDTALAPLEERAFEDGEHKARPLSDPAGEDAYVVQSLHGGPDASVHDKLIRLLFFCATLREHGAARVTAVVPYLAYARKDRQTKPFDPVSMRYLAQLVEAAGIDGVITLEVHNVAAFQNAFRVRTIHIDAGDCFTTALAARVADGPVVVASPDPGGVKRAQLWRESLAATWGRTPGFAFVDKRRSAGVVSGGELVAGEVAGATVLLFDDLISTGGTLVRAATALRAEGARRVLACAAHGLFNEGAAAALLDPALDRVYVTDSVPPFRLAGAAVRDRVEIVSAVPRFAAAVAARHASWRGAGR